MGDFGLIPQDFRDFAEMVVQAFYEPQYYIVMRNLLDMGDRGGSLSKLAENMKLGVSDLLPFLNKLKAHRILKNRINISAEELDLERQLQELSSQLSKSQQRRRFPNKKKNDSIWFVDFTSLVNVIQYRFIRMKEELVKSRNERAPEYRCPNRNCKRRNAVYRLAEYVRMRASDGRFRCRESSCQGERDENGNPLGYKLEQTQETKMQDKKKMEKRQFTFNLMMQPILEKMQAVRAGLKRKLDEINAMLGEDNENDLDKEYERKHNRANVVKQDSQRLSGRKGGKGTLEQMKRRFAMGNALLRAKRHKKMEREKAKEQEAKQNKTNSDLEQQAKLQKEEEDYKELLKACMNAVEEQCKGPSQKWRVGSNLRLAGQILGSANLPTDETREDTNEGDFGDMFEDLEG